MADELPDMSMFGTGPVASDGPDMSMFQAAPSKAKPRTNLERFTGNLTDAVERSGLGQLSRNIQRGGGGLGYIDVIPGGLADRALDATFGNERPILPGKDRGVDPVDARERARRAQFEATSKADPFYKAPGGAAGRAVAGAVTLGGQLGGGILSPENWVGPGKTLAQQVAGNAAIGAGTDVLLQGGDISTGVQDEYSPLQTGGAAVIGGAVPIVFKGAEKGVEALAPDFVKNLFAQRGKDLTPEPAFQSQVGKESPINTPELKSQQRQVFSTGTADDINAFYDRVGGPRPSKETIDKWLETREAIGATTAPKPEVLARQVHRDTIKAHIDNETKTWKNKPNVNIIDTLDEMADDVRATAIADGITPDNTVGFLGSDGQVHIFANQVKTPEAANAVLFHEALGHYGLAQQFGTKLDSTLQTLVARNVGQFGKKLDTWMRAHPDAYGGNKLRAAEEVLAEMSEKGPLPKAIGDAIVAGVRQFARNMGVNLKYSDAEISHILAMAHDAVINGKGRDVIGNRFGGLNGTNYQGTDFGATAESRQMYAGMGSKTFPTDVDDPNVFYGPDGYLRSEISDHNARWDDNNSLDNRKGADLDTVLIHPELFKAYPELRNVKVIRDVGGGLNEIQGIQGWFDHDTGNIHISPTAFDPKSTVMHELQHWIQYKEGFAYGGNRDTIRLDNAEALGKLRAFYERQRAALDMEPELGWTAAGPSNMIDNKLKAVGELEESSEELTRLYKVAEEQERAVKVKQIELVRIKKQYDEAMKATQELPKISTIAREDWPEYYKLHKEVYGKFNELSEKHNIAWTAVREAKAKFKTLTEALTGIKGKYTDLSFDLYNLLTGEVEARDVQKRMMMTPEERTDTAPYSLEGIQPNEMINHYPDAEEGWESFSQSQVPGRLEATEDQVAYHERMSTNETPRRIVYMSPQEYIEATGRPAPYGQPVDKLKGKLEAEGLRDIPWLHYDQSGKLTAQEGRHRAAALEQMGYTQIPVAVLNDQPKSRQMTPEQLQRSLDNGDVHIEQLERTYERVYENYEPTYRSDAEVRRAAVDAGMTPAVVKKAKNMEDLSARIYRAQEAAKVLDERLAKLAEKEGTPDWSARDADTARKIIADHNYILTQLYDDKSELGRALRISKLGYTHAEMRAYKELLAEDGGTLAPLADDDTLNRFLRSYKALAAGGQNPNGVNALIMGLRKPNWEEYLLSARVNMMLSGMSTHVTAVTDMIDGIGYDLMDSTAGLIPSLGREGLRAIGIPVKPGIHPAEVGARYWGVLRAAMEASTYVDALQTLKHGSSRQTSGGRQYARIPVLSKVGDLIAAEDQFFRAFATNMHLYGLGVRKAVEEARAQGKKPTMDDLITQGASYARNPDKELLRQAERASEENLLLAPNMLVTPIDTLRRQATLGPNASAGDKALAGAQRAASFVVNFLLPFVRTATNSLYQRVWRRTPLTIFDPHTVADLNSGGVKADIAMGRIMLGTASVALAWAAAGRGEVSGEGPDSPYKKAIKMATGWRPQSVKVEGEEGTRYQINQNLGNRLNIFDMNSQTATMVASIREAYEKGANQGQVATGMKMATYNAIKSLSNNVWLGDIADTINIMSMPGVNATDKRDQWVANQVASFTPNLLAQVARVQDQGQPMTTVPGNLGETIEATVKSRIPGQRETLPDRRTPFGNPVQSGAAMAGQTTGLLPQGNRITGGAYIEKTQDPAELEIARLDEMEEKAVVTAVRRTIKIDGENIKLNNEEFSQYQEAAGRAIVETLRDEMDTEEWVEMPDDEKAAWIRKMQKTVKKQVRDELFGGTEDD